MNIRGFFFILCLLVFLVACTGNTIVTESPVVSITPSPVPLSSPTVTATGDPFELTKEAGQTQNAYYGETQNAMSTNLILTPSLTPKPSITPFLSPTFDPIDIQTITPAPPETCPESNPNLNPPDFDILAREVYPRLGQDYLNYFKSGGTISALSPDWQPDYIQDLTNDGIPEYVFQRMELYILGCVNGSYELLLERRLGATGHTPYVIAIEDANLNGLPEITAFEYQGTMGGSEYEIFEWDGNQFVNLAEDIIYLTLFLDELRIEDIDHNGIHEYVWDLGHPGLVRLLDGLPWREETYIYMWNGEHYFLQSIILDPPEYRFQAIQDGDRASLEGDFDKALDFYQQAITDEQLEWWTLERRNFLKKAIFTPTPQPTPVELIPDPNEYPNLVAYAYYRIMLLSIIQDNIAEATTIYETLQEMFPPNQAGYPFVELASAFWNEYQTSNNIEHACSKAIQYADGHPKEIFAYLGNSAWSEPNEFGEQSLYYGTADVCPFK